MVLSNATTDYLSRQPPTTNQLHNTTGTNLCSVPRYSLDLVGLFEDVQLLYYIITLLGNINCFLCLNI